jgi:hypothetical protein
MSSSGHAWELSELLSQKPPNNTHIIFKGKNETYKSTHFLLPSADLKKALDLPNLQLRTLEEGLPQAGLA